MYNSKTFAISVALAACVATQSSAAVFTDRDLFEAQGTVAVTEPFDTPIAEAQTIVFDSGFTSMTTRAPSGASNNVSMGTYNGFAQAGNFRDVIFDFGQSIFGFGALFDDQSLPFGTGTDFNDLSVNGIFDGMQQSFKITEGFFGLTSTTAFETITFSSTVGAFLFGSPTPFGGEQFSIDDLSVLGTLTEPSPVPLPATGILLLAALGGFGGLRARRSRAVL